MKISPEQILNEAVTLTEAIQRLKGAPKDELYVVLQRIGNEGYLIPMSFAPLLVGSQSEGKLYEQPSEGILKRGYTPTREAITGAIPTITAPVDWIVHGFEVEIFCSAVVAARNLQLTAVNLPTLLPGHVGGIYQIWTTVVALVADDYGGIFMGHGPNHWTNINNVPAIQANENPLPKLFTATSQFTLLCAGLDVTDQVTLTVWHTDAE